MSIDTTADGIAHRSRWGYHSCDMETFLQVKYYHKLTLRAYRMALKWGRWDRKTVYRSGSEPPRVPGFSFSGRQRHDYDAVLTAYRAIRKPAPDPESVEPFGLSPDWFGRMETLRTFFADSPTS